VGLILHSSIPIAFERRRVDPERLLTDHSPPALAAVTAAELLIGAARADTPERRARREAFIQNIFARVPIIRSTWHRHGSTPCSSPSSPGAAK
jgi:tRNA(fMet)-specific endonuclease VapC